MVFFRNRIQVRQNSSTSVRISSIFDINSTTIKETSNEMFDVSNIADAEVSLDLTFTIKSYNLELHN